MTFRKHIEPILVGVLSLLLLLGAWSKWLPIDLTEAFGFVTGGICVWLITRDNIANWPVGLANNIFFALLFWRTRLYADMGLQAVYFVMGVYGWWHWLRGGSDHSRLTISRTRPWEWVAIALFLMLGTWGLRHLLVTVNGSAPFWDAQTTTICLSAQYLICRKRIENWWLWIVADIIYVPLYFSKNLPLTAILYAGFIGLCLLGWHRWHKEFTGRHE